jgi:hypothetical protein
MAPEARIFIPKGREGVIRLAVESHGGEVIEIEKDEKLSPRYKREYKELLERFGFLEELLIKAQHPVTSISVEDKKEPPPTTGFRYDSGHDDLTYVHKIGDITVHEYITDDRQGCIDSRLVIYTTKTGS